MPSYRLQRAFAALAALCRAIHGAPYTHRACLGHGHAIAPTRRRSRAGRGRPCSSLHAPQAYRPASPVMPSARHDILHLQTHLLISLKPKILLRASADYRRYYYSAPDASIFSLRTARIMTYSFHTATLSPSLFFWILFLAITFIHFNDAQGQERERDDAKRGGRCTRLRWTAYFAIAFTFGHYAYFSAKSR